jgi:hypothetical protein
MHTKAKSKIKSLLEFSLGSVYSAPYKHFGTTNSLAAFSLYPLYFAVLW